MRPKPLDAPVTRMIWVVIVPEHIDVPRLRVGNVVGIAQIELFDPEVGQAERLRLFPQRRDVGRDLHRGNDLVAVLGDADRRRFAEARAGARNQNGL
jgi:hypothetical protein